MKKTIAFICLFAFPFIFFSQEVLVVSGGDVLGNGNISFTVGQLFTNTNTSSSGSISEGIQQSIELYTLNISSLNPSEVKANLFPNPTSDFVMLSIKNSNITDLFYELFDVNGRSILSKKISQSDSPISLQNFASGIYILKVNQSNKTLKTFKLLKN